MPTKANPKKGPLNIKQALKGAWSDLHDTQSKADILRKTYQGGLAQFKAETLRTTEAQEIKKLLHVEEVRKTTKTRMIPQLTLARNG